MIDTHTHLNFEVFNDDLKEVVGRAKKAGVKKMVIVGTDGESSRRAVEIASQDQGLYAAVGIHPHHAKQFLMNNDQSLIKDQLKQIEQLLKDKKVVAVGEIGLDYHVYRNSKKYKGVSISKELIEIQKELFEKQVKLAMTFDKPIIVHSREAKDEVLFELKNIEAQVGKRVRGVFHCFEGSKKYAQKILEAGFYISFTGNITYEKGRDEVSKVVPLDRLLLETDSPYMLPYPLRRENKKMWRNEPGNVKITAQYHAKIRNMNFNEVVEQTTLNAKNLFGI